MLATLETSKNRRVEYLNPYYLRYIRDEIQGFNSIAIVAAKLLLIRVHTQIHKAV